MKRTTRLSLCTLIAALALGCPPDVEPAGPVEPGTEPESPSNDESVEQGETAGEGAQEGAEGANAEATGRTERSGGDRDAPAAMEAGEAGNERTGSSTSNAEPSAVESTIHDGCAVRLNRFLVAAGVEEREPVLFGGAIPASEDQIWVYMDFENEDGPEADVRIDWTHSGDAPAHQQSMAVGESPRWRTWVHHRVLSSGAGEWTVTVRDPSECVVGELTFVAVP